ncbi:hypothetical protein IOD16_19550 [Saccharothrix sp. 6-C]|uniref:hypothetical protein n=1 Tax=Saccharothrix sp. 6-C TaxID=2781735 RepID=UPI0019176864|nr:hypothetical protein [Saccharothrix sp. 6-C]QQQ73491.1 hypothetical protein IOD16_19550 [Saccharothrix sp. 6-C]
MLDPATAELVRLDALLEVVVQAVALQDRAEAVIADCAQPGEPSWEVARSGRVVAAQYSRLSGWAADLVWQTDRPPPPQRIVELLRYHLVMLDCALRLAFPRFRTDRLESRRLAMTGLGSPARELRDLESALRHRITTLSP